MDSSQIRLSSGDFPNSAQLDFKTEGIKYAGSKKEIIPSILQIASNLGVKTVCDGFAGTTRVGQAFLKNGYHVWSNDLSDWSNIMGLCYFKNLNNREFYRHKIDHLNSLEGLEGWFTENYGGSSLVSNSDSYDGKKKIWQIHNTKKLDAIRIEIDRIAENEIEKAVLLASLIYAMDKVDSTVGHHTSYLREWSPRSYQLMKLEVPELIIRPWNDQNIITQGNIFDSLKNYSADLYYFDPPYGSANEKMPPSRVRYASYYHLWTTIIRNDQPKLVGVANRREDVSDKLSTSIFEEFRKNETGRFIAVEAIEKLIQQTPGEFIILSYNNQGRATFKELVEACHDSAKDVSIIERHHKSHVMRSMRWTNQWTNENHVDTREFLFVLGKNEKLPKFD